MHWILLTFRSGGGRVSVIVGLAELWLSYQNGQELVEESLLACRDKIRMRTRSFWWQKNKEPTCSVACLFIFSLWFIFFQCLLLERQHEKWLSKYCVILVAGLQMRPAQALPVLALAVWEVFCLGLDYFSPCLPSAPQGILRFLFLPSAQCLQFLLWLGWIRP